MNKTLKFEIVTGVNKGYFHNNKNKSCVEAVGNIWQNIALQQFNQKGIYISSVINSSKTVYNTEWGCPLGGEDTVTITGTANPSFVKDLELWRSIVIEISKALKCALEQSTLTLEFQTLEDFIYLQ